MKILYYGCRDDINQHHKICKLEVELEGKVRSVVWNIDDLTNFSQYSNYYAPGGSAFMTGGSYINIQRTMSSYIPSSTYPSDYYLEIAKKKLIENLVDDLFKEYNALQKLKQ